jgi:hypothetical protein
MKQKLCREPSAVIYEDRLAEKSHSSVADLDNTDKCGSLRRHINVTEEFA